MEINAGNIHAGRQCDDGISGGHDTWIVPLTKEILPASGVRRESDKLAAIGLIPSRESFSQTRLVCLPRRHPTLVP